MGSAWTDLQVIATDRQGWRELVDGLWPNE